MRKTLSAFFVAGGFFLSTAAIAQSTITNPAPGSGDRIVICSPVGSSTVCN